MPKIIDHDQYRKELLSPCFDLFAEKGYASLTMREIATALGVSTGTLYHYFESKEDLFEKLIDYVTGEVLETVTAALPHHASIQDRIEAYFGFNESSEDHWTKMFLLFVDYYRNKKITGTDPDYSIFNMKQEEYVGWIRKYLGIDDLEIANFIFIHTVGFIAQHYIDGHKADWKKQFTMLKEMILLYINHNAKS